MGCRESCPITGLGCQMPPDKARMERSARSNLWSATYCIILRWLVLVHVCVCAGFGCACKELQALLP